MLLDGDGIKSVRFLNGWKHGGLCKIAAKIGRKMAGREVLVYSDSIIASCVVYVVYQHFFPRLLLMILEFLSQNSLFGPAAAAAPGDGSIRFHSLIICVVCAAI